MSTESGAVQESAWQEALEQIEEATAAKKCWQCGCLHNSLAAIERAFPDGSLPSSLAAAMNAARERVQPVRYDCLGCAVCFPALAINALGEAGAELDDRCPTEEVEPRDGWPPFPGSYTALRFGGSVAVCTLTDEDLGRALADSASPGIAITGTLQTENLGIERVISNVLANPNIRFLLLCGADSRKRIGHLPGQSFLALAQGGLDERSRIVGAKGKRPVLRNVSAEAVEHFRQTVEVVDRIGDEDVASVLAEVVRCAERSPGPAEPFSQERGVAVLQGHLPARMVPDPAGYFVVYLDPRRDRLSLEHFRKDGVLDTVIEGRESAELYIEAIERGLLTRLDHAAYLGRELARAEASLRGGTTYVQDGAPERPAAEEPDPSCACGPSCGEEP